MARSSFSLETSSKALRFILTECTILCKHPTSSSTEKKTSGFFVERALDVSSQILSLLRVSISPELLILLMRLRVSSSISNPKNFNLEANLATLSTLRGSSSNAEETFLNILLFKSSIPLYGSINSPLLSLAIAFTVRSLLSRSSSRDTEESNLNLKPLCPAPDFLSFLARAYSSLVSGCRKTGKSLPIFL